MTFLSSNPLYIRNFTYPCGQNSDCHEIQQNVKAGTYLLEVWGAQGGNSTFNDNRGGRGGYSLGLVSFCRPVTLYIFIGAKGVTPYTSAVSIETSRSFNGGGKGYFHNDTVLRYGSSGGGATDIRVNGIDLSNRIIVAGGGGGAGFGYEKHNTGGYGGGIIGGDGESSSYQGFTPLPGKGATQDYGGQEAGVGTLGQGADHLSGTAGAGGGGGYYGGGSGQQTGASGGGGSGFICMDKSCRFPFIKGELKSGNDSIPDFHTGNLIKGNYGNGFARISLLTPSYYCMNTIMISRKSYFKIYVFIFVLSK